jgi:hypothetical protein
MRVFCCSKSFRRVSWYTTKNGSGCAQCLALSVGICPGNNENAGKRKSGRIRCGNVWVRPLLCEFAQAGEQTRCAFKGKFQALS